MKKILTLTLLTANIWANNTLNIDLDHDGKNDKVYFEDENDEFYLSYELSTQNFKKVRSDDIGDYASASLKKTNSGFKYHVDFMRAGGAWQFRYEKKTKKMRLIGMSRYEFGNAAHDGSGEASVNLLTNKYVGEWSYFNEIEDRLIKLLTIEKKTKYKKIYLESFAQVNIDDSDMYRKAKKKDVSKRDNNRDNFLKKKFPNYRLYRIEKIDAGADYLWVLESKKKGEPFAELENAHGRKVVLIKATKNAFKVMAQNNFIIGCSTCGGATGDPFRNITVKGKYISFEELYGSCSKEFRVATFKYNSKKKNWYLHRFGVESSNCNEIVNDEVQVKTTVKTTKDFGVVEFSEFNGDEDYDKYH
jgi:hypothetical protein